MNYSIVSVPMCECVRVCLSSEILSVYFFSELPLFFFFFLFERHRFIVLPKWFPQMYIYCNIAHINLPLIRSE